MKHKCPICRKPTDSTTDADFPFCSERCRLADLGNWASERYVVSAPVFDDDALEQLLENADNPTANKSSSSGATDDSDDSGEHDSH
jgi:endogenous inhibitor of DNA gyrase (YacG/DUF329 family)